MGSGELAGDVLPPVRGGRGRGFIPTGRDRRYRHGASDAARYHLPQRARTAGAGIGSACPHPFVGPAEAGEGRVWCPRPRRSWTTWTIKSCRGWARLWRSAEARPAPAARALWLVAQGRSRWPDVPRFDGYDGEVIPSTGSTSAAARTGLRLAPRRRFCERTSSQSHHRPSKERGTRALM
jgi:hypothetical protein